MMGSTVVQLPTEHDEVQVIGYIVRKRSLGKHLAFVDVQVERRSDGQDSAHNNGGVRNSGDGRHDKTAVHGTTAQHETHANASTSSPASGPETSPQQILKMRFQRNSIHWQRHHPSNSNDDGSQDGNLQSHHASDNFPTKASMLPYGAKVQMTIVQATPSASSSAIDRSTDKSTPTRQNQATALLLYDVCAWSLLNNPRDDAVTSAQNGDRGISYSAYLQARGNAFRRFNTHKNHDDDAPAYKRTKSEPPKQSLDPNATRTENGPAIAARTSGNATTNVHGDKRAKALRAQLFATWLIDTYGKDFLQQGGVLDVAGGKGKLSIELAVQGQAPCTWVDPFVRGRKAVPSMDVVETSAVSNPIEPPDPDPTATIPTKSTCTGTTNITKKDVKRIRKSKAPMPQHLAQFFNTNDFLTRCGHHVQSSSLLIGLHPDECTEDIVTVALQYDKPFAIVPCCVFPGLFPTRFVASTQDGTARFVRTYDDLMQYLLLKDERIQTTTLPFEGRNQVVYMLPKSRRT